MDDDGLEVIDLTPELDPDRTRTPRRTPRFSRRQVAIALAVIVAAVAGGLVAHNRSGSNTQSGNTATPSSLPPPVVAPPTTAWVPPVGLTGLASGRAIAVVLGTPVVVGDASPVRAILDDIPGNALVDVSQRGAVLLHYNGTTRVIAGPKFSGARNVLPAAVTLLPDADGDWWSTFGELQSAHELHALSFPNGTIPVARVRRGYLLVDRAHTSLVQWSSGTLFVPVAAGNIRVLAVSGDLVAWTTYEPSYAERDVVRVTNLATRRTTQIAVPNQAVTARFSPDRSRIAVLVGDLSFESMVFADTASGNEVAYVVTASGGNGLATFDDVPPAFEPVPFGWDRTGRLVVVTETTVGYFVKMLDPVTGTVLGTVAAPDGLQQLIPIAS